LPRHLHTPSVSCLYIFIPINLSQMNPGFSSITVNIPAYNEENRIGSTLRSIKEYFENILVIDDGSQDKTKKIAETIGARVIDNEYSKGYLGATKTGFRTASTPWIITVDADGEHRIEDLIGMSKYALSHEYDLVMGTRKLSQISRPSEVILSTLASIKSPVFDTGTGLRIIRSALARQMELYGKCVCGTFVLEAGNLGAKIGEYSIHLKNIEKPRRIAWEHLQQFFILNRHLFKK